MFEKKFKRKIEDFKCRHCGTVVKGGGYTDHCPECLWSRHIDINPGDRKEKCKGMMEPIDVETKNDKYIIYYKCTLCGYRHRVKSVPDDDLESIINLCYTETRKE